MLNNRAKKFGRAFIRQLHQLPIRDSTLGVLLPPEMKSQVMGILEQSTYEIIVGAVAEIKPISRSPSAFAQIDHTCHSVLSSLTLDLEKWYRATLNMASGSVVDSGQVQAIRQQLQRQLDIYRADFAEASTRPTTTNEGGRPRAHDWEAANNAVWRKIFYGDLDPVHQPQADIERAFLAYFTETSGREPSPSSVRDRAKRIKKITTAEA